MAVPVPVFRISGASAMVVFLYVVVMFGSLHLLATANPSAKWAKAWLSLGF